MFRSLVWSNCRGLRDGSLRFGGDLFSLGRITTKYLRVPSRGGRSDIHSGSVQVYSGFGFSGSKISAPFGYF